MGAWALKTISQGTLPEESMLFQEQPNMASDAEVIGDKLGRRIQRGLWAGGAPVQTTPVAELDERTSYRLADVSTRIERAVVGSFSLPVLAPDLSLQPLQEWEGYVAEVGETTFTARLVDRTAGRFVEDEAAEFPVADLSDDDRRLLVPGAVFRWVIGYLRSRGGSKRRVSQITFRRMPAWSRGELREASKAAEHFLKTTAWD
jgi:hypothetical protein